MPVPGTYGKARGAHYDVDLRDRGRPPSKALGEMTPEDLEAWLRYQQVREIIKALGF